MRKTRNIISEKNPVGGIPNENIYMDVFTKDITDIFRYLGFTPS